MTSRPTSRLLTGILFLTVCGLTIGILFRSIEGMVDDLQRAPHIAEIAP